MASTINAAVGGIVNTADSSGELALQASGSTVATLTTSGGIKMSLSGNMVLPAGTVSAPALTTTGDTNTGVFFPAADTIAFAEGGAEVMRIDSSGNVGIGTTSATSKLDVRGEIRFGYGSEAGRITGQGWDPKLTLSQTGGEGEITTELRGGGLLYVFGGNLTLRTLSGYSQTFVIGTTEYMRLNSSGNLLVGTTTDVSGLTGVISDVAGNVRAIPQSGSAKTTSYTLVKGDVGEFINVGSGGSVTIPDAVFATGDVVSIFNNTSGNITITCTITTAYIGGTDADKATITLATRGIATILFISGTVCVINGNVS